MLSLMHVGATVHDLPAAMADYAGLVTGPWVVSDPLLFAAYDGIEGGVVDQRVTMAFARLAGGPTLELIAPSAETPDSPQRRLLEERPGISHIAYWSSDLATTARELIAATARACSVPPRRTANGSRRCSKRKERTGLWPSFVRATSSSLRARWWNCSTRRSGGLHSTPLRSGDLRGHSGAASLSWRPS